MKILALSATLTLSLMAPTLALAEDSCPENEVRTAEDRCVCADDLERDDKGICAPLVPASGGVAQGPLPQLSAEMVLAQQFIIPTVIIATGVVCILFCDGSKTGGGPTPTTSTE